MIFLLDMIDNGDDLNKFHLIYEKYKNTMYSVAYDISQNSHDAEDIVQVSLVKLINILYRIDKEDVPNPRCKNLMITITKNTAIDHLRKSGHSPVPYENIEKLETSRSSEDLYIETEDYQNLIKCINELKDKYKDVLRLRVLLNLNSKETAQILNINEINVNTRFMRAKKLLASDLKEQKISEK